MHRSIRFAPVVAVLTLAAAPAFAQYGGGTYHVLPPEYGPFNAHILAGGDGLEKPLPPTDPLLKAVTPWSMTAWVEMPAASTKLTLIAGAGDARDEESRFFAMMNGRPALWFGKDNVLVANAAPAAGPWHLLAATFDGEIARLYCDGAEVAKGTLLYARVAAKVSIAPVESAALDAAPFGGHIAEFTLSRAVLSDAQIAAMAKQQPEFALIRYEEGAKPWPVQTRGQAGYRAPQDAATLPRSLAPLSAPKAAPEPPTKTTLRKDDDGAWTLSGGWKLAPAPKVTAAGEEISQPGFRRKTGGAPLSRARC